MSRTTFSPSEIALEKIIRYGAHLGRELDRTLQQLERLRRIRTGQPTPSPIEAQTIHLTVAGKTMRRPPGRKYWSYAAETKIIKRTQPTYRAEGIWQFPGAAKLTRFGKSMGRHILYYIYRLPLQPPGEPKRRGLRSGAWPEDSALTFTRRQRLRPGVSQTCSSPLVTERIMRQVQRSPVCQGGYLS